MYSHEHETVDLITVPGAVSSLIASARRYISHSKAANTLRAYAGDWRHFSEWCSAKATRNDAVGRFRVLPASPELVACYIAELADTGSKVSTITRRMAAIAKAHEAAGHGSPCSMRHAVVAET